MSNLINFSYVKLNGSTSYRTVYVLGKPSNKYSAIDLSELSIDDQLEFANEADKLYKEYQEKFKTLQASFDVKHNFRQFLESGVSEIEEL